jgi:hypothetical protein
MNWHYFVVATRRGEKVMESWCATLEHARWYKDHWMQHDKTIEVKIYELVEVK